MKRKSKKDEKLKIHKVINWHKSIRKFFSIVICVKFCYLVVVKIKKRLPDKKNGVDSRHEIGGLCLPQSTRWW